MERGVSTYIIMALNSGINGERVTGLSCFTAAVLIAASSLEGLGERGGRAETGVKLVITSYRP